MNIRFWFFTILLIFLEQATAKRIDMAHKFNLADVNVGDLIEKVLPALDISKPLYELGRLVNRGGQAISPALEKAGNVSISVGIALINIGTLLKASSRALSKRGTIGGNPNFINEAVATMLLKRKPQNGSLRELALKINRPHGLKTYQKDIAMQPLIAKPILKTSKSPKRTRQQYESKVVEPLIE